MARYLAITGGVGGAKLALGLTHLLGPDELSFVVNTGDDFEHLGLHVCPDLDTLMYTLGGVSNTDTGWGRAGETWQCLDTLAALGGESWFRLGDRDLAVHLQRSARLRAGATLSTVSAELFAAHGIAHRALPMSDQPVRTLVHCDIGTLAFQHYFVRERCAPRVSGFSFAGAERASPAPGVLEALGAPDLAGVIICPSNPFLSIDPILAVGGVRAALAACAAPVIAVSPIVAGAALKGPTAKIMAELSLPQSASAVAAHYAGLIDGFILDETDRALLPELASDTLRVTCAQSVMSTLDDRVNLAHTALEFLRAFQ
ncbi:MAG: 2-phospho-L-lactate transferase [Gammaproteobacteria bacterium]|nr:2-phospho-L-lactate transferase [Gammaproteobacteria bacterium]